MLNPYISCPYGPRTQKKYKKGEESTKQKILVSKQKMTGEGLESPEEQKSIRGNRSGLLKTHLDKRALMETDNAETEEWWWGLG